MSAITEICAVEAGGIRVDDVDEEGVGFVQSDSFICVLEVGLGGVQS